MNHVFLALLSGGLCGVMGTRYAARIRGDAALIRRWQALLLYLRQLLSEGAYPLPEAFALAANEQTACDTLLLHLSCEMQRQPLVPLGEVYGSLGYRGPGEDTLRRMMERLGRGTLETRCLCVQQAAEEMDLLFQSTHGAMAKDAKMWSSLGWTAGACVTLLLL